MLAYQRTAMSNRKKVLVRCLIGNMSSCLNEPCEVTGNLANKQPNVKQSSKHIYFDESAIRTHEIIDEGIQVEGFCVKDGTEVSVVSDRLDSLSVSDVNTFFTFGSSDTVRVSTVGTNETSVDEHSQETPAAENQVPESEDEKNKENEVILLSKKEMRPVYKFQVVWSLASDSKALGSSLRHHVIMAPYCGKKRAVHLVNEMELPAFSPLRTAVERCRDKGMKIVTGFWKHDHYPTVILFDLDSIPKEIVDKCIDELTCVHSINVPVEDAKFRNAIMLGYVAIELLVQFENAIGQENLSKKSWIRFHNWKSASGPVFANNYSNIRTKIALLINKTQLGDMKPADPVEANMMARAMKVEHKYALELKAAYYASHIVIAEDANADVVQKQLFKRPAKRVLWSLPKWMQTVKGKFTNRRYEHVHQMRTDMALQNDNEEEDDPFLNSLPKRKVRVICFSKKMLREQIKV